MLWFAAIVALRPSSRLWSAQKESVGVDIWGNPVTEAELAALTAPEPEPTPEEPEPTPEPAEPEPPKRFESADFAGSEWKIGVLWGEEQDIEVSWFRCKADGKSEWGFKQGNEGRWSLDDGVYLTVTRNYFLGWNGRRIYSAKVTDDCNYLEGYVRGWKPWEPASIMGQWQAFRLGVERPNPPPWVDAENRVNQTLLAEEQQKDAANTALNK